MRNVLVNEVAPAALATAATLATLWAACGPYELTFYQQLCGDPYGFSVRGDVADDDWPDIELSLSPAMTEADLEGAREACRDWNLAAGVGCGAHRDNDWVPDRHDVPVHRCYGPRYAEGSTAVTYPDSRDLPEIVVNGDEVAHRRLLAHEIGHVIGLNHVACDPARPSIMTPSLECMADAPTSYDAIALLERWR